MAARPREADAPRGVTPGEVLIVLGIAALLAGIALFDWRLAVIAGGLIMFVIGILAVGRGV